MPRVAVGIAVFILLVKLRLFGTTGSLVLVHAMLALPFAIVLLTASLLNVNRTLEEAAMDLGAGPLRTFWQVTLPQIRAGLIVAAVFAFITSFDNYTISMWLKSAEETPLPLRIFFYIERIIDPSVAAVFGAMIVFPIVLVIVTEKAVGLRRAMNV